ncbi:MAG: S1/P1 nuclease [Chryseolinea sp.]
MIKHTVAFLLLVAVASAECLGWGATGHRATGLIAEKYLSKKARKELQRILQGQSLAMASTWMDDIRSDSTYDYASDWHWVTILDGQTYDLALKNPNGDIIQTIERLITELKSKKLTPADELSNLKMLIHLIGDIHQPLHVGGYMDSGGGDVKVTWFRTDSNLHKVWDSDMINDTRLSFTELAESLEKPDDAKRLALQKSSVRDWAYGSMTFRKPVYDYGDGKLGYAYTYKNFHIVRAQILAAGIRIAGVLNDIYR